MKNPLIEIMSNMTRLTPEEETAIIDSFPIKTFKEGKYLLREGQIQNDAYFVISGCIREYILKDGLEKTTSFYTENQTASDYVSATTRVPSNKFFECMEDTRVAIFNLEKEKSFYRAHPRFEMYCREGSDRQIADQQEMLSNYITMSPEERYLKLIEENPSLAQRVPQYHIASYLGIKPETLSRIRKRIALQIKSS